MSRKTRLARVAALPLLWALYLISHLAPRRRNRVAFGGLQDQFADNSRYCFLSLQTERRLETAWITSSGAIADEVRAMGMRAYRRWSLRGLAYCLTAQVYVTTGYLDDVNFWCSGRSWQLSLWHGMGPKKIERDITVGPLARQHRPGLASAPLRLALPHKFRKPDQLVSPSRYTDEIFPRAFGIPASSLVRSIYPRTRFLVARRGGVVATGLPLRTVLFCPTWRDRTDAADIAALRAAIAALTEACSAQGYALKVKLHPNVEKRHDVRAMLGPVAVTRDLYDELAEVAMVVSDYSSIIFECLVADIPVALFAYDGGGYQGSQRDLYFDVHDVFEDIWFTDPGAMDVRLQIERSKDMAGGYGRRFGFRTQDLVTPALLRFANAAGPAR